MAASGIYIKLGLTWAMCSKVDPVFRLGGNSEQTEFTLVADDPSMDNDALWLGDNWRLDDFGGGSELDGDACLPLNLLNCFIAHSLIPLNIPLTSELA